VVMKQIIIRKIWWISIFTLLLVNIANAKINDGLVAFYPFNSNANDQSGYGNHCSVNGATLTIDRFGNSNSAYKFDGVNDYLDCGNPNSLKITGPITISAWIEVDGYSTDNQGIVAKYDGPLNQRSYNLHINNQLRACGTDVLNAAGFIVSTDGEAVAGCSSHQTYLSGTTALSTTKWTHVVGVFNPNNSMDIYIDGILNAHTNTDIISDIYDSTAKLIIGCQYSLEAKNLFKGTIDDVRIYNRALTSSEIIELYRWNDFDAVAVISRKTDLDNDGDTDGSDLSIFLASFGSRVGDANYNIKANFDNDSDIDSNDLKTFSQVFGSTDLPIILPKTPILNQAHYTDPIEYAETYVESVANIKDGGCVPVSFAMLFVGHYNEFKPTYPPINLEYNSQNIKNLMDFIAQEISIPIPPTEWQILHGWTNEQTKINVPQVLEYMNSFLYEFESDTSDYNVEAEWGIEYDCATVVNNDQLISNIVARLKINEPVFAMGHMYMFDVSKFGGHAAIISGYAKFGGIEYFRVNDTYSNLSAHWYRIERGDVCVINENCSPNYCPIKLIGKDGDWVFEMKYSMAWPQTYDFRVVPK
jgi:hypothetical protein